MPIRKKNELWVFLDIRHWIKPNLVSYFMLFSLGPCEYLDLPFISKVPCDIM